MKNAAIRNFIIAAAFAVVLIAWGGVFAARLFSDSVALFTFAVTAAALATEGLLWVLAIVGGIALFASRKRLWKRMSGRDSLM